VNERQVKAIIPLHLHAPKKHKTEKPTPSIAFPLSPPAPPKNTNKKKKKKKKKKKGGKEMVSLARLMSSWTA
jgi:hypothetical protein